MANFHRVFVTIVIGLVVAATAQNIPVSSPTPGLNSSDLAPSCASNCINTFLQDTQCSQVDIKCICQTQLFLNTIACCIPKDCSASDQTVSQNLFKAECFNVDAALPDDLSCNATESSATSSTISSSISVLSSAATSSSGSVSSSSTGTGTNTGTTTGQNTATTSGGGNGGGGGKNTDHSLAIGLGVGLGVGIPLTLGVLGFFFFYIWRTNRKDTTSDKANPSGNAGLGAAAGKSETSRTQKSELPADSPGPRHELAGDERFQENFGGQGKAPNEMAADRIPERELPGDEQFRRELP